MVEGLKQNGETVIAAQGSAARLTVDDEWVLKFMLSPFHL